MNERVKNKQLIDEIEKIVERSKTGELMHHKLAGTLENKKYIMSNVLKAYQESIENSKVNPNSGIERYISSSLNYLEFIIKNQRDYKKEKS